MDAAGRKTTLPIGMHENDPTRSAAGFTLVELIIVMALLAPVFSVLAYAWVAEVPALTMGVLPGILKALGIGLAFCMCGLTAVLLSRFAESGQEFSLDAAFRAVNIPLFLVLLLRFSGITYGRLFKPAPASDPVPTSDT